MAVRIFYETHCVTADNAAGVMSGWNDPPLSAEGMAGAAELGARHSADPPAAVFTSDLRRASQTCEIAFAGTGVSIVVDRRLRECDFGDLNGAPLPHIETMRPRHVEQPFPNGQSFTDVLAATAGLLAEIAAGYDGRQVLIVAHSANKWSLDCLLKGASMADLVSRPFEWRPGWRYALPADWTAPAARPGVRT